MNETGPLQIWINSVKTQIASLTTRLTKAEMTITSIQQTMNPPPPAARTNYFNWSCETLRVDYGVNGPGTVDLVPAGNPANISRVTFPVHSGTYATKLVVIGNDGGNQQHGWELGQQNPPYPFQLIGGRSIYYRWWMRIETGFSWGSGPGKSKSSRTINAGDVSGGYTGYIDKTGLHLGEAATGGPADPPASIAYTFPIDSQWHEYIVRVKGNSTAVPTPDAELEFWADTIHIGAVIGGFWISTVTGPYRDAWGSWMVKPYFQLDGTISDGGTIYLDDFSVDDGWNSIL